MELKTLPDRRLRQMMSADRSLKRFPDYFGFGDCYNITLLENNKNDTNLNIFN